MMAGLRTMRFVVGLAMSCFLGMQTLLWHRAGIHVMEDSDAAHLHRPIPTTTANRPKIQALHVPATLPALPSEQGRQQQQQQQQQQAYPNRNPTPTQCTSEQLDMIEYQLPPKRCKKFANKPWQNRCSFSYATRCPKAVWLEEFYRHEHIHNHNHKPIAIYVGCNKAMDAVNTLRMISSDTAFDKDVWRDRLFANQTVSSGNCNQEFEPQFALKDTAADLKFPLEAVVHCIEASPITARRLKQTIEELGWQSSLVVVNAAMAASDGYARFPDRHVNSVGVETISMVDCTITGRKRFCKKIQQYKLDTYAQQFVLPATQPIDFLSIDVEGFDWEVLLGATRTLERVNYLEFEYNWKGAWGNQTLSSAIGQLKEQGFVCYWAGSFGNLWRITDCWMDYYDLRFWSNVACVNTRQEAVQSMAARMEELFLETLASGRDIRYHNASSANTNGKLEWGLS
jgi:FkbM family methyltransferase